MKKLLVLSAGIVIIIASLLGIILQLDYWNSINWNLVSISRDRVVLSIVANIAYLIVLFFSKVKVKSLWALGILWTVFNCFTLYILGK